MASVTLGQHPAQHHLDSDQQLFHKLKSSDRKKFTRKWSLDKITTRNRESDMDSGRAAVSASLALFSHEPPSASHSRGASPRSKMDGPIVDIDRENANNNNGIFRRHSAGSRRSSVKGTAKIHASSSPQEVRNPSARSNFSCPTDELEGLAFDKLTQARSGVVKMRSEPLRMEAWSIFKQRDPRVKAERGEGHIFISRRLSQDWCDACNHQISSAALKCQCKWPLSLLSSPDLR